MKCRSRSPFHFSHEDYADSHDDDNDLYIIGAVCVCHYIQFLIPDTFSLLQAGAS